jgi:hypothetical protein
MFCKVIYYTYITYNRYRSFRRSNLKEMEEFFYDLTSFAEDDVTMEGMGLVETIKRVKPTILIGQ